ncbi:MAG: hypothetical protein JXB49_07915, partial [Bacteroidales bacterium]|nr:hypothetical protein [Bacteroidales bacterium]
KTQVKNEFNTQLISQYDYTYNNLGLRDNVNTSGEAFSGSDIIPTGKNIDYTTNTLNQYTQVTTNNPQPATDNLVYDADGNLDSIVSSNSTIIYEYNAENRLIAVEPEIPGEGDTKVEFVYDYMGRRIQKKVYAFESIAYSLQSINLFVYDGWNLIEEQVSSIQNPVTRYFVWGLDLSQSTEGSGGVGGLLSSIQNQASSSHLFCYEANGNVGQLVKASDGTIVAHYEYDPFGILLKSYGIMVEENPFRFSTKYYDVETDLYYYGYRYYSTNLGRWINRDPSEEKGGINLYVFVNNSPINLWDYLGLYTLEEAINLEYRSSNPFEPPEIKKGHEFDSAGSVWGYTVYWTEQFENYKSKLTLQEVFDIWFKWENARGPWWTSLSDRKCPRKLCKKNGKFVRPEKGKENWHEPQRPETAELLLHPGAVWSMRSLPNADYHANQCTYDAEGVLLPLPPASGTVDWHKTGRYDTLHWAHDVEPIDLADYIDRQGSGVGGRKRTFFRDIILTKLGMGRSISTTVGPNMAKYYKVRPLYAE